MDLGMVGYNAYGESVEWKAYNGERMPDWDALPDRIKTAWNTAADKVRVIAAAMVVQEAVGVGYGGCLPSGQVVDRRLHPEAMPLRKNTLLGIGAEKDVAHNAVLSRAADGAEGCDQRAGVGSNT